MHQQHTFRITLSILTCFLLFVQAADEYTDENRPYEFGFNVEVEGQKQQHRHEKKDKDGIIMGEFGFVTADNVYHVTVYATDKEGRFKILSMKNIHLKSSPAPSAPTSSPRQGHSLALPASVKGPSAPAVPQAIPTSKPQTPFTQITLQQPARSCSSCSIPTTTVRNPPVAPPASFPDNVQPGGFSSGPTQAGGFGSGPSQGGGFGSGPSQGGGFGSGPSQAGGFGSGQSQAGGFGSGPSQAGGFGSGPSQESGFGSGPSQASGFGTGPSQAGGIGNGPAQSGGFANGQPLAGDFGSGRPQAGGFGNGLSQGGQNYPQQPGQNPSSPNYNVPSGPSVPAVQSPHQSFQPPLENYPQPGGQEYPEIGSPEQTPYSQGGSPGRTSKQYTGPEQQFGSNLGPNGPQGNGPVKPTLVSAQMQIVDKNTDINALRPGETRGLPPGLTEDDMSQLLYTFNYTLGFHGHFEEGYTNGAKKGYYFVTGRNGVRTRIDYVADDTGFHPKISQEVLDLLSDDVPKEETEKDEKYGLKGYEFKWLYYPVDSQ